MAKVNKKIGFDRMSISAKFESGADLRFSISRNGERLTIAFSNDINELKRQSDIVEAWLKLRTGEKNIDRFNRLEEVCKNCKSGAEFIAAIS
jgi:hypothetical protein